MKENSSGEFAFLLACVRRFFRPETLLPPAAGLDWTKLADLSDGHAVMAFLYRAIQGASDVPAAALADLRDQTRQAVCFDLALNAELAKILQWFEQAGIPVIAMKGPALSTSLSGNVPLRSSTDLDLLIRPQDVLRGKKVLEGRGYQFGSILHWPAEQACLRGRDSQISFSRKIGSAFFRRADVLKVDLHWRLLPGYFPDSFDDREVWCNLRQVPVAETFASTLPPERLLLFLCAHGMKHLWSRLGWICDVARLLQTEPGIDWTSVFNQARQTDTSRMVVLGLLLASELLGVALPPATVPYVAADSHARSLAAVIGKRLHDGVAPASAMESALFSRHGFERVSHRARFVCGIFLEPTDAEYEALKLPPLLHWMYYPFRPARLVVKYAGRWLSRI